jgi:hypothetical protein
LERIRLQKKLVRSVINGGQGKAPEKPEEDMANDDWAEITLGILWDSNTTPGIEEGDNAGWHFGVGDEV